MGYNIIITIKKYPKNKEHFKKLKQFAQQILDICKELKIRPVVWGGLAYFGYSQKNNCVIHYIDFLISDKSIKKVMGALKKRRIKYQYIPDWHSLVVCKGKLKIDFDPNEWYHKGPRKFKDFNFDGFIVKVVSLESLIKMYKHASEESEDKPKQHKERLVVLKRLFLSVDK